MRVLGAILAGGEARRFGGDKAAALWRGTALIDHVARALGPEVDELIVVGRDWPGLRRIDDLPAPGLGPLGGLAGALVHAGRHGYAGVLSAGCDCPNLPADLRAKLQPADAVVAGQPVIGLWRADHAERLLARLSGAHGRSLHGWADAAGARRVDVPGLMNVNRPEDLGE
ncbi:MAG: molybdenum cofactor guanylyltransferase [Pseudomonadota bacterium]